MMHKRDRAMLRQVADQVAALQHTVERLEGAIAGGTSPRSSPSDAAYEGLRRMVVGAVESRRARLVDLARIDAAVFRSSSHEFDGLLAEMLEANGMRRIVAIDDMQLFDLFGDPESTEWTVAEPAYIDENDALIRLGRARSVDASPGEPDEDAPVTGASNQTV